MTPLLSKIGQNSKKMSISDRWKKGTIESPHLHKNGTPVRSYDNADIVNQSLAPVVLDA